MMAPATLLGWLQRMVPGTARKGVGAVVVRLFLHPACRLLCAASAARSDGHRWRRQKPALAVHGHVCQPARCTAGLRRAGGEAAAGRFIPVVYHFFVANLVLFWLLLFFDIEKVIVARLFFVWVSVFNLFVVSVFWSFMADLFTSEQGKRLFGFIGAGGTAGALLGPVITIWLSGPLGPVNLLIAAAVFLELAVLCVHRIEHVADPPTEVDPRAQRIGGSAFAGLCELIRSPYLLGVAGWVSLLSFGATIAYFAQANIVSATIHDAASQTRLFAGIDLAVGLLSLATQVFATAAFLKRFGTGISAAALPAIMSRASARWRSRRAYRRW